MDRRTAIKLSAMADIAAVAAPQRILAVDYKKPVPEAKGLTSYLKDAQVQLRWKNIPLTTYRAHPSTEEIIGETMVLIPAIYHPPRSTSWRNHGV